MPSVSQTKKDKPQAHEHQKYPRLFGVGQERDTFIENLAMLLTSGMSIVLALEALEKEIHSKAMRRVVEMLKEDVNSGTALWQALKKTGLFPLHVVSLLKIGESAGRLSGSLDTIATTQRKEQEFRSKIRSAMMYPAFVLGVTLIIGVGIAWFILPRLSSVFAQLHLELPAITRVLISTGEFLGEYGAIAIPIFIAFIGAIGYLIFAFPKTKYIGQALLLGFPGISKLIMEMELARAGFVLGTLLGAGLPVVDAVHSLSQATRFRRYENMYTYLKGHIEEGGSFQKGFRSYPRIAKLYPSSVQAMIIAGEQSGRLPETFLNIGKIFEGKTETTTKNISLILEPIFLLIVWVGVVGVALAVILPIYSLIGGLN